MKNTPVANKIRTILHKESFAGYMFVLPFVIGLLLFMVIPMATSLYYSFCDYDILSAPKFVGLLNYKKMFEDEILIKSLGVTFFFVFVSVPLRLMFALLIALLLQRTTKMTAFYRAAYYLPSIIGGSVAVSVLWKRLFSMDGVINKLLMAIGMKEPIAWLGDTRTAIWTLIILAIWQFGSSMLIFLAALKQVPMELYESAKVDGAGSVKQFFKITLPLMTSTIFFNLIMQTITAMLAFTQCFIITQGQPMNSTMFYAYYMYQQSFSYYKAGYGSAMAWVMLGMVALISAILFKTKKYWVYEGGY